MRTTRTLAIGIAALAAALLAGCADEPAGSPSVPPPTIPVPAPGGPTADPSGPGPSTPAPAAVVEWWLGPDCVPAEDIEAMSGLAGLELIPPVIEPDAVAVFCDYQSTESADVHITLFYSVELSDAGGLVNDTADQVETWALEDAAADPDLPEPQRRDEPELGESGQTLIEGGASGVYDQCYAFAVRDSRSLMAHVIDRSATGEESVCAAARALLGPAGG